MQNTPSPLAYRVVASVTYGLGASTALAALSVVSPHVSPTTAHPMSKPWIDSCATGRATCTVNR